MIGRTDSETLKRLEEEGKKRGLSPRFLEFHKRLLSIQSAAEQHIDSVRPTLDKKTVDDCVEGGIPLIKPDELKLDWSLMKDMFAQIAAAFADYPDLFGEPCGQLKEPESLSVLRELIKAQLDVAGPPDASTSGGTNEQPLMKAIIFATFKPFLVAQSKAWLGFVNQEQWRRGYCPICGSRADFAFLDRENGARWLVCCWCDAEWLFQRLQCPYCDNRNQDSLAYFTDENRIYRLYVCEQCHTYIKAIDLRYVKEEATLPVERILTLGMDAQAQEKGYGIGCHTVKSI
jgi:FdhE protein